MKKTYGILGLGIFGSTVAKTLSNYDCEVIAVDIDIKCVERVANDVTTAMQLDITDISALKSSGIGECDVVVVGLGNHLEESVLAIINLKELGVPYIVAKAKNKRYMQILETVGANKVVRPEKEMGEQIAKTILSNNIIDLITVDEEFSVVEIIAPNSWIDKSIIELDVRNKYKLNILGVKGKDEKHLNINVDPNYIIREEDHLLVLGQDDNLYKFSDM